MYIRFVIQKSHARSGRRQGLFFALKELAETGDMVLEDESLYSTTEEWFNQNLNRPRRFSRSTKAHATNVAISWFKESAVEHIRQMHVFKRLLERYGIGVEVLRTERPGYIVYEDEFQVTAQPFQDTIT